MFHVAVFVWGLVFITAIGMTAFSNMKAAQSGCSYSQVKHDR